MSAQRRILLVEDDAAARSRLGALLQAHYGPGALLEAGTLAEARMHAAAVPSLHLALIDLRLPDGSGVELIGELARTHPHTLVVVSTIYDDDGHLFPSLAAGAHGYLLKDLTSAQWLTYLRQLETGMPALSPSIARRVLEHFRRPAPPPVDAAASRVSLTGRETEVLSYIGRGLRVTEVAGVLGLAETTVSGYVKDIYRKLNISSRAEAALEAVRRGLA